MSVVTILLPLALLLGFGFLGLYLWAVGNDQFADGDTPALRMLLDEKPESMQPDLKKESPWNP